MTKVRIGERWVGAGEPAYIVAEAGSNHNGSFEQALRLIDAAADARADAVKFQQFKAAKLYPKSAGASDYLNTSRSIYDIIHDMETPDDWVPELAGHCRRRGLAFLSSPFDEESADLLDPWVPAFKVASYEMTHAPLLRHIARKGKPMIVSTGMTEMAEIAETVELIQSYGVPLILLQCTSTYPTAYKDVKLGAIPLLQQRFGVPVGLSDHSMGIYTALGAVAKGACMLEKHFTISRSWPGPDQGLSIEPQELRDLVQGAEAIYQALGADKTIIEQERPVIGFARASVVVVKPIKAGERLTEDNIWVKRPADGEIPAKDYQKVVGKVANVAMAPDHQLKLSDLQ